MYQTASCCVESEEDVINRVDIEGFVADVLVKRLLSALAYMKRE